MYPPVIPVLRRQEQESLRASWEAILVVSNSSELRDPASKYKVEQLRKTPDVELGPTYTTHIHILK